jgi:hypothetical protein
MAVPIQQPPLDAAFLARTRADSPPAAVRPVVSSWPGPLTSHGYAWIVLGLALVALLSRVYTTNSLAGEPTSDEYLYAVHARDLARGWAAGQLPSLEALSIEGRSVVVESAALSFVLPWDALTIGRTVQALLNALCIPMTFVLGRQIGLPRSAALAGALLLLAVPEFQELAWRFWTDSQATLLSLMYLTALVSMMRRAAPLNVAVAVLSLAGLVLTKESAAITFTPFLVLGAVILLSRRLPRGGRKTVVLTTLVALVLIGALAALLVLASGTLGTNPLLQRTFGAGPLILTSVRDAVPQVPTYSDRLTSVIGPRELGSGFLWATLIGYVWLAAQTVLALVTAPARLSSWVLGWCAAMLAWLLGMSVPARDLALIGQADGWVIVAAAGVMVAIGTVELYLGNARRSGWGLALLGLVVLAVLAERLIIVVTPKVSAAALTFRPLMPIVPLYAVLAGGALWAAAGAVALLLGGSRSTRAALAILASALLVVFWSPLVRERLASQPLLGRVADRGADPDTPQGLRVQTLVEAEGWLKSNVRSTDLVITGIPRHLAWYADLGVDGMESLIDLNSQDRPPEQRRQYLADRLGPRGAMYAVDFNVNWLDPIGEASKQWRLTYDTLAAMPNLETAYLKRDRFGNPVFYVIRNNGYATAAGR